MHMGIAVMVIAIVAGITAGIVFYFVNKRLKKKLETEYGKKRH